MNTTLITGRTPRAAGLRCLTLLSPLLVAACDDEGACGLYDEACAAEDGADTDEPEVGCSDPDTLRVIDASDEAAWVYLDLDACDVVAGDSTWDLGFSRFAIIVNGGVNGDAGVEAGYVDGVALDEVSTVPAALSWDTDREDDEDEDEEPQLVFGDWYDYDFTTHALTPKQRVYVVRSTEGAAIAVQIEGYYSDAGTSGHVQLRFKELEG